VAPPNGKRNRRISRKERATIRGPPTLKFGREKIVDKKKGGVVWSGIEQAWTREKKKFGRLVPKGGHGPGRRITSRVRERRSPLTVAQYTLQRDERKKKNEYMKRRDMPEYDRTGKYILKGEGLHG